MKYYVEKVITPRQQDDFVNLTRMLYKDNPCYIPDLDMDVRNAFRPKEDNPDVLLQPFIAYDEQHKAVGRIVGIINNKANRIWDVHCVRFGMIEFIDDPQVSKLLIEAVEDWGRSQGMNKIQGPLGITDFDKEGMLVEDFDQEGSMITIYNPAYYPQHLENMGFKKEVDWLHVRLDIPQEVPPRIHRAAETVRMMYDVRIKKLSRKDLFDRGYADKIFELLNKAYKPLFGFSELSAEQCKKYLNQYFPLADLRMIPVVEDNDGQIVAVAITIGSLNQALKKANGRLWPTGWYHLLHALKIKHEKKVELLLIAVDPSFQGLGINALLFDELIPVYNQLGYTWAETGEMLEDNFKVQTQWKHLPHKVYKRRRCYCKEI